MKTLFYIFSYTVILLNFTGCNNDAESAINFDYKVKFLKADFTHQKFESSVPLFGSQNRTFLTTGPSRGYWLELRMDNREIGDVIVVVNENGSATLNWNLTKNVEINFISEGVYKFDHKLNRYGSKFFSNIK